MVFYTFFYSIIIIWNIGFGNDPSIKAYKLKNIILAGEIHDEKICKSLNLILVNCNYLWLFFKTTIYRRRTKILEDAMCLFSR
jgi:hypothetical protein